MLTQLGHDDDFICERLLTYGFTEHDYPHCDALPLVKDVVLRVRYACHQSLLTLWSVGPVTHHTDVSTCPQYQFLCLVSPPAEEWTPCQFLLYYYELLQKELDSSFHYTTMGMDYGNGVLLAYKHQFSILFLFAFRQYLHDMSAVAPDIKTNRWHLINPILARYLMTIQCSEATRGAIRAVKRALLMIVPEMPVPIPHHAPDEMYYYWLPLPSLLIESVALQYQCTTMEDLFDTLLRIVEQGHQSHMCFREVNLLQNDEARARYHSVLTNMMRRISRALTCRDTQ